MKTFTATLLTTVIASGMALAQRPGDNDKPLPVQGESLPALTAFDAEGNEFPLQQRLKGRHGVIVFGCLT